MTREDLDRLLIAYHPSMLQWAKRLVSREDADDVVQQVAVGLLQRQRRYHRFTIPHPERYLYMAITRQAKRMRAQPTMEPEETLAEVEALIASHEDCDVWSALDKLPPYISYFIRLVYFWHLPLEKAVRETNRAFHKHITMARARYWLRFRGRVGAIVRRALE